MDSWWALVLAVTAWLAIGIVGAVLFELQASLEKWKTKVAVLETGVSIRGDLLVKKQDELEKRIAGVEALLVSTVGQETEDFCRAMDELMERMEKPEEKKEPAQEGPKLVLSEKYCGVFRAPKPDKRRGGKKGAGRG